MQGQIDIPVESQTDRQTDWQIPGQMGCLELLRGLGAIGETGRHRSTQSPSLMQALQKCDQELENKKFKTI